MAENRPAEAAFEKLIGKQPLTDEELAALLNAADYDDRLFAEADLVRRQVYGDTVFVRGLIEFTNYCKNDCYYCGIRAGNSHADRYRLTEEEILSCCREGYALGFRTFVLQGGEDLYFTTERIWWQRSMRHFPTVLLHSPSAKRQEKTIRPILMQVQGAICCATKQRIRRTMKSCIPLPCLLLTANAVCMT